jgi:3-methyladenine DNA glycosylase AlkD
MIDSLYMELKELRDPEKSGPMRAYMKNRFPFLGVQAGPRRQVLRKVLRAHPELREEPLIDLVRACYAYPEREMHYVACDLINARGKGLKREDLAAIDWVLCHDPWWDTVDSVASNGLADYLQKFPEVRDRFDHRRSLWHARALILHQLKAKEMTDEAFLFDLIRTYAREETFFIAKAMGWALRAHSKTDPAAVRDFLARTELPALTRREASKYL